MLNSKINKKGGYASFGLKKSVDISWKLNNDFIINFKKDAEGKGNLEAKTGKVIEIKFNKEKKNNSLLKKLFSLPKKRIKMDYMEQAILHKSVFILIL